MDERRKHPRIESRKHHRIPVTFKVTLSFSDGKAEGQGSILNISQGGCAVQGSRRVPEQALLRLCIQPSDWIEQIVVENASVKWARGRDFGVEFMNVEAHSRDQIQQLLGEMKGQIKASA